MERSSSKIDELYSLRVEVHEQVLVLNIPMDDASSMDGHKRLHYLRKEASCFRFVETASLGDVVVKVLARVGPVHHENEALRFLEEIKQMNNPVQMRNSLKKDDFQGQHPSVLL